MTDGAQETLTDRALIIGYGNPYRRDDGVALVVINSLRQRIGLHALEPDEDGLDNLGYPVDTIMLHQLLPELVPVAANYEKLIFVDAHTSTLPEHVKVIEIHEMYGFQAVTHHLSPQMLLALVKDIAGRVPESYLVSIRGEDFDFGEGLSAACAERTVVAVDKILELIGINL
jgi:hydrogenase maturation protease